MSIAESQPTYGIHFYEVRVSIILKQSSTAKFSHRILLYLFFFVCLALMAPYYS